MPVSIDIGPDNRIWANIPWAGGSGPKRAKSIAGVRPKYEKSKTAGAKDKFLAWTYPLDMNTCRQLREVFGQQLAISPQLIEWAKLEVAREEEMIALAKSDGKMIVIPSGIAVRAPELSEAIQNRPYQKVGAKFIVDGENTLIADQPGLGKTLETLAALVASGARRILVFAPRTAMETVWAREAIRWTGIDPVIASGTPKQREEAIRDVITPTEDFDRPRMLICNPEMVRIKKTVICELGTKCGDDDCLSKDKHVTELDEKYPDLFKWNWDAIIVDECHRALIGKNIMAKKVSQTRLGMMLLPLSDKGLKVALSGTPYRGKPELLWGIMNWLNPKVFTSFWRWVESYFELHKGYNGSRIIGELRPERMPAYERTLAPYVLRRTKAEVAPDLPPKMYGGTPLDPNDETSPIAVWLEMEPAQEKLYRQMADESEAQLESGVIDAIGTLPEMTRLKQFAICSWDVEYSDGGKVDSILRPNPLPSNKYEWLKEFLTERQDEGRKVVVASQYTKVINAFGRQLHEDGFTAVTLTGETKQKDRAGMVDRFQTDPELQVFLINTSAGGVAITLDAADDLVFLDETYIPDDQEQVEDRIHRVSRIHQVTIWKLASLGTIEEAIAHTTEYREGIIKERLDGSRGVEFAKLLLKGGKR